MTVRREVAGLDLDRPGGLELALLVATVSPLADGGHTVVGLQVGRAITARTPSGATFTVHLLPRRHLVTAAELAECAAKAGDWVSAGGFSTRARAVADEQALVLLTAASERGCLGEAGPGWGHVTNELSEALMTVLAAPAWALPWTDMQLKRSGRHFRRARVAPDEFVTALVTRDIRGDERLAVMVERHGPGAADIGPSKRRPMSDVASRIQEAWPDPAECVLDHDVERLTVLSPFSVSDPCRYAEAIRWMDGMRLAALQVVTGR